MQESKIENYTKINTKEELDKTIAEYRVNWEELRKRKEAKEPSVDHWRLRATVMDEEAGILDYVRNNGI